MTNHQIHAARMQSVLDEKAARLKSNWAIASRVPKLMLAALDALDAATARRKAAPLPSGPVTYDTRWQGHTIPVTVPPDATLHALIARTKAAHGLQNRIFPPPVSAMPGRWTLKARATNPPELLSIFPPKADDLETDASGNRIL